MPALLDSNILIYAACGAHAFLDQWILDRESCVSTISIPEVLGYPGLSPDDEELFEAWFGSMRLLEVDTRILRVAARLRRQRRMTLGDAIIAATAVEHDLDLLTRNTDDFLHIPGLRLLNPFCTGDTR